MQYNVNEDCCFLCKEKLRVELDLTIQDLQVGAGKYVDKQIGLNGCPTSDENAYFVDAKRIRVSLRKDGKLEKREVTVHVECHRQLEKRKAERESAKAAKEEENGQDNSALLGKRLKSNLENRPAEKRPRHELQIEGGLSRLISNLSKHPAQGTDGCVSDAGAVEECN